MLQQLRQKRVLLAKNAGFHALQPDAGFDLMFALRPVEVIVPCEQIARGVVVATHVKAVFQLQCGISNTQKGGSFLRKEPLES